MKRIPLLLSGLLCAALCQAQLQKGRILLGGAVNFGSEKITSTMTNVAERNVSTTNLTPFGGVFVRNNLLTGISLTFRRSAVGYDGENQQINKTVGGGILLRRYLSIGAGFSFYVNGGLDYLHGSETMVLMSDRSTVYTHTAVLSASPGLAFAFGKRLLLETSLSNFLSVNYFTTKRSFSNDSESKVTRFNGGVGVGGSIPLNIGFNIMLGK